MLKLLWATVLSCFSFHVLAGTVSIEDLQNKLAKARERLESVPARGQKIRKIETRLYDRSYRDFNPGKNFADDHICDHRFTSTYTMDEVRPEEIYYTYQVDLKYRFLSDESYCSNNLDKNHSFPSFVRKDAVTVEKFLTGLLAGLSDIKIFESTFHGRPVFSIKASAKNGYGEPMAVDIILRTDRSLMANPAIKTVQVDRLDGGLDFTIRTTLTVE
ncbi:MAG: hypothetical protein HYV97_10090 [Bdellovibrio sp.]|nr:hypothetical protein [Bdellovibrio sp.]